MSLVLCQIDESRLGALAMQCPSCKRGYQFSTGIASGTMFFCAQSKRFVFKTRLSMISLHIVLSDLERLSFDRLFGIRPGDNIRSRRDEEASSPRGSSSLKLKFGRSWSNRAIDAIPGRSTRSSRRTVPGQPRWLVEWRRIGTAVVPGN